MTYDPLFYPKRCDEFPDCRCAERLRSIHLLIDEYLDPAKPQPDRDDVVATITWAAEVGLVEPRNAVVCQPAWRTECGRC
jgi:hypothetical protein